MPRHLLLTVLLAALACSPGDDAPRPAADAGPDPASPQGRAAEWRATFPDEPLPAVYAFGDVVTDSALAAFLAEHPLFVTAAYVRAGELVAPVPVDSVGDAAANVAAMRAAAREAAVNALCVNVVRIRGMYGEGERTLTLPGGDLGRAREVLDRSRRAG